MPAHPPSPTRGAARRRAVGHGRHARRHRALLDRRPSTSSSRPTAASGTTSSPTSSSATPSRSRPSSSSTSRASRCPCPRSSTPSSAGHRPGARAACRGGPAPASCSSSWATLGVPSLLVTMSWRSLADTVVGACRRAPSTHLVTGDEVSHGQAAPGALPRRPRGSSGPTPPTASPSRTPRPASAPRRRPACRRSPSRTSCPCRPSPARCGCPHWTALGPGTCWPWRRARGPFQPAPIQPPQASDAVRSLSLLRFSSWRRIMTRSPHASAT